MPAEYWPVVIFFVIAGGFAFTNVFLSWFMGPRRVTARKQIPYECGITPTGDARRRFAVKFYLVAMLFILFDIEAIFLYPWAVYLHKLGLFGFVEMVVFLGILIAGFLYLWKRGAFEWD